MDWKSERDALIAQTYAFVQSVAWKLEESASARESAREAAREPPKETLTQPRLPPLTPLRPPPVVKAAPAEPAPIEPVAAVAPTPLPVPRPTFNGEVKDEIRARIASFRAHQERFNRERAEYFSATLARVRATKEDGPPRSK
jgi:hypothetical protein